MKDEWLHAFVARPEVYFLNENLLVARFFTFWIIVRRLLLHCLGDGGAHSNEVVTGDDLFEFDKTVALVVGDLLGSEWVVSIHKFEIVRLIVWRVTSKSCVRQFLRELGSLRILDNAHHHASDV